jgi:hypothetical protein
VGKNHRRKVRVFTRGADRFDSISHTHAGPLSEEENKWMWWRTRMRAHANTAAQQLRNLILSIRQKVQSDDKEDSQQAER